MSFRWFGDNDPVPLRHIRQIPGIADRSLSIDAPHWDNDTVTWMARNRMNVYALQGSLVNDANIDYLDDRGFQ